MTSRHTAQAKDERFWTLGARREMVRRLLAEWILEVSILRAIMIMMIILIVI